MFMITIKNKKYLLTIILLTFIIITICSILIHIQDIKNQKISGDEGQAKYIEMAIKEYIVDTGDTNFDNLSFNNGNSLKVISGKTNSYQLVLAMQQKIVNKNNNSNIYGPWLKTQDYSPRNKKYLGYKIDIYQQKKDVKVILAQKLDDCVVIIHKS